MLAFYLSIPMLTLLRFSADPDNITLPERFQADAVPHNQYERFWLPPSFF